jgi:predicted AlkP superfamily pyrophosphatase or phosphodiesterase
MNTDKINQLTTLTLATLLATACVGEPVLEKKVLVIGIDGVRPDVLAQLETPNIDALIATGCYSDDIQTGAQTISGPGWSSMLIGAWPDKHQVVDNDFTPNNYAEFPDFLTRLERANPQLLTFTIVDWPPLGTDASGGPLLSGEIDSKVNVSGDELGYPQADSFSVGMAARVLEENGPDASFVYIGNPDVAAHEHGGQSEQYFDAIRTADSQVGQLVAGIQNREDYAGEDWLILISTDHGHKDEGGHGGTSAEETTVFYLASGPSAISGRCDVHANIVDVAVTAMAHMGVTADSSWLLDGRVTGLRR